MSRHFPTHTHTSTYANFENLLYICCTLADIPLQPPENIGVPCQQEPFDLELLTEKLQNDFDTSELRVEELERISLVRKVAEPADIMDLEEVEYKICQYYQLWKLYAEVSFELKRKSNLSQESVVAACKV